MRGQQQAGPSGRNPSVTDPGLPLTLWLFDLPGTSEGQREKETLNQNSEGLKIKRVPSLLSIRLLPAANTVAANKMLDCLDPPAQGCPPVCLYWCRHHPHQKKGPSIKIAGPAPAGFLEPALVVETGYLCFGNASFSLKPHSGEPRRPEDGVRERSRTERMRERAWPCGNPLAASTERQKGGCELLSESLPCITVAMPPCEWRLLELGGAQTALRPCQPSTHFPSHRKGWSPPSDTVTQILTSIFIGSALLKKMKTPALHERKRFFFFYFLCLGGVPKRLPG